MLYILVYCDQQFLILYYVNLASSAAVLKLWHCIDSY